MQETKEEVKEVKSKIKFYETEIEVTLPLEYDSFKVKLGQILGQENDFSNLKLVYKGEPEAKIEITNAEDYQNFVKYIQEKKVLVSLEIEVKEGADIDKSSVSKNILSYKQKNSAITFPVSCSFCRKAPLNQLFFFCKECNYIFCMQCEVINGPQHPHPYYKVATKPHYAYLNIGGQSQMERLIDNVESTFNGAYNSVITFFGKIKDKATQKPQQKQEEKKNLVQEARAKHDLSKFTDQQIEEALKQSNDDIDKAVFLLNEKKE